MLDTADIRLIMIIVDTYHRDNIAFQLLLTFRDKITPEHYLQAGELIAKKNTPVFNIENFMLNHLN